MKHLLSVLTAVVLLGAVTVARAEEKAVEVPLKEFKLKSAFEGGENLVGFSEDEGKLFFYTNGKGEVTAKVAKEGEYEITVAASGPKALDEFPKFKLTANGEAVGKETALTSEEEKSYTFTAKLKAGENKFSVEFTNDAFKENEYDRNLYVHSFKLNAK